MKSRRGRHCVVMAAIVMVLGSDCVAAAGSYRVTAPGESDYTTYCAPCHGVRGNGDGPLAGLLVPRPARHSDARLMNALSDDYVFRLLKEGGPAVGKSRLMGTWGGILSDPQICAVIRFMRSLAPPGRGTGC